MNQTCDRCGPAVRAGYRIDRASRSGVPVPGSGLGGNCVPGEPTGRVPGWWRGRLAWIIVVQALGARCLGAAGG